MPLDSQHVETSQKVSWRLSEQHQFAIAGLVAFATIGLAVAWCWTNWRGNVIDLDKTGSAPAKFTVNVNTANANELMAIPGVGPELARKIVEHRDGHYPFKTLDELVDVHGLGPKKLVLLKKHLMPIDPR